tara:strand:- start:1215 stop:1424 length:210 start_codon:yes stop_codon:yes gene_type:complete
MADPLFAVRRLRSGTGGVVLPGCPIPGSDSWSAEVRERRIKQGFAKEGEKPKKAKAKKKAAKAKSPAKD